MPISVKSGSVTQTITPDTGERQESLDKPYKEPEDLRHKFLLLRNECELQEVTAGKDALLALQSNGDQKYWAACGRQAAYRHVLNLIAVALGNPSKVTA